MFNKFNNLLEINNLPGNLDFSSQGEMVLTYYGLEDFKVSEGIVVLVGFVIVMECIVIYFLQPPKSQIVYVDDDKSIEALVKNPSPEIDTTRNTAFSFSISSALLTNEVRILTK